MRPPSFEEKQGLASLPEYASFSYLIEQFIPIIIDEETNKLTIPNQLQSDIVYHANMIRAYKEVQNRIKHFIKKCKEEVIEQQQGETL